MSTDAALRSKVLAELLRYRNVHEEISAEDLASLKLLLGPAKGIGVRESLPIDCRAGLLLVASGRVEILHDGRADPMPERPFIAGIVEFVAHFPGVLAVRALTPATCFMIPVDQLDDVHAKVPWVKAYFTRFFEAEVDHLYWEKTALELGLSDCFLPGGAGIIPGPYMARDVEMQLFVMQEDPERLARLLPPHLRLLPGFEGRYLVAFGTFADMSPTHGIGGGRRFHYHETAFFVPCVGPGIAGVFCPILCPDNYLAIAIGRELFGFPKRHGETLIDLEQDRVDFGLMGGLVLEAHWSGEQPLEVGPFFDGIVQDMIKGPTLGPLARDLTGWYLRSLQQGWLRTTWPDISVFVRHQAPSPAFSQEDRPVFEEDHLIGISFRADQLRGFMRLENPKVVWHDPDFPLRGECRSAWRMAMGMRMGEGRTLWHYDRLRNRIQAQSRGLRRALGELASRLWEDRKPFLTGTEDPTQARRKREAVAMRHVVRRA